MTTNRQAWLLTTAGVGLRNAPLSVREPSRLDDFDEPAGNADGAS